MPANGELFPTAIQVVNDSAVLSISFAGALYVSGKFRILGSYGYFPFRDNEYVYLSVQGLTHENS